MSTATRGKKANATEARARVHRRLDTDTLYYSQFLRIVDKEAQLVKLTPNAGQMELERVIREQEKGGKPIRVVILKARQIGFSTWVQAKLLQRVTRNANHQAIVVAHDKDTAGKLFKIAERMYDYLPDDPNLALKPPVRYHGRSTRLEFGEIGHLARRSGVRGLDSAYMVDTARDYGGGAQADTASGSVTKASGGRGATHHSVHASEVAYWPDVVGKMTALKNAVGRRPGTMFVIESTANGHNHFKDLWDDAEAGRSGYAAFFWPWWREATYAEEFANDLERDHFRVGDTAQSPYAEEEPELVERFHVTPEQLLWRRLTIADECSGRVDLFKQEYPATPEEAFISSSANVFDPALVKRVFVLCDRTDPRVPSERHPGPELGIFTAGERNIREGERGRVEVPSSPIWTPRKAATFGTTWWKIWRDRLGEEGRPTGSYLIAVDTSSGARPEGQKLPAAHAAEIIDHKTGDQVAEYVTRGDVDLFAEQVYIAALYFRQAWVVVEITGGWGGPVVRRLYFDYRHMFIYRRRPTDRTFNRELDTLGWDTNTKTKPIIEANMAEELRQETHGIASRGIPDEMLTYIKDDRGRTGPQRGKFSDRLVALMIAKQARLELPIRPEKRRRVRQLWKPRDKVTGY